MADYMEKDVTEFAPLELGLVIEGLLAQAANRSIDLFLSGQKTIMRVWFIDFDLEEFSSMEDPS